MLAVTKKEAFENGLRFRVQKSGEAITRMSILDRMAHYKVPGVSVSLIEQGKIEWSAGFGVLSTERSQPVTPRTLFQAASISKLITAIGVIRLVQERRLSLDQDINTYLRCWNVPENEFTRDDKVTIRRLLSHSAGISVSGFPGYAADQKLPTLDQILNGVKPSNTDPIRVISKPGTKVAYSGGGTMILQQLVEDLTGTSFPHWTKKNVLEPLGMTSSTFEQPLPIESTQFVASGHLFDGSLVPGKWHTYPELAAAGLWTTSEDLARVAIALYSAMSGTSNKVILEESAKELLKSQAFIHGTLHAGLGIFLRLQPTGFVFEHGGANRGFNCHLWMNAKSGSGIIIMTNGDQNGWYLKEEILNSAADTYGWPDSEPVSRNSIPFKIEDCRSLVGKYLDSNNPENYADVFEYEENLYLRPNPTAPSMQLFKEGKDRFFTLEENQTVSFVRDMDKNRCRLGIHFNDDQIWGQEISLERSIE